MTADAGLEHGAVNPAGNDARPVRSPAMRAYCATLSRFTSSVQSTELMLRNNEVSTREDRSQREHTAAARLRGIERARAAADDGFEHSSAVRDEHGLTKPGDEPVPDDGSGRTRRPGAADLGIVLTSLARRRDELRLAEAEFEEWLRYEDELSRKIVLGVAGAVGFLGAVVMFVAGSTTSAAGSLALLIACVLAVVAAALTVAITRRLPRICVGPGLARLPDAVSMAGFGARFAGLAAASLLVANIAGSTL